MQKFEEFWSLIVLLVSNLCVLLYFSVNLEILLHLRMDADSALKESIQKLQAKWSLYLKEREEWIQDMVDKIQYLQSALSILRMTHHMLMKGSRC
ncbi:hypothetical protein SLEP1_g13605 [Rubroshorea leprosula]|uniref:Uncharacterized protein n=1 Tax=Rubroshorea leprosula TaxID=152421 RepID=A0AAV5IQC0_9ROSI|nr:hypothetical protein SLEP1_g13605 [Rubroshorea leprosula]